MPLSPIITTLTGGGQFQSNWNFQKQFPINPTVDQGQYQLNLSFTNGAGANQIQNLYTARLSVTSVTPGVSIDLTSLVNPAGDIWTATFIKEFWIVNLSTVSGDKIIVGGAGSNPWIAPFANSGTPATATMTIGPGGWWHMPNPIDGLAVNSGSKIFKFDWDGVSEEIDFDVIIKGNN